MCGFRLVLVLSSLVAGAALCAAAPPGAGKSRPAGRPGEVNTPPAKGERFPDRLKVGDLAPDFVLSDPTGKREVRLSSFRGQRPVVLIFGSLT
ncbi:hypothetical protein H0921_15310 [thermophilic bacterium 2918]|uniref:Alkyl hydroperoxide reductase subunit C/ Thiol specific antioxidant domain-containing protein n=2 Tax=Thermogemmata fonticola TaxID=2755323 RepID=A0A7V9AD77_9BACT|nr:hypothetical protein [Thermogemmata fonticola]